MNSEELEQSLRTEFESYLKDTIADMKQEVSEFQQKIESEFDQHKARIDESVKEFSEKFGDGKQLEESFQDSIAEHLKLAREDGSKITAAAYEEAEKLRDEQAAEAAEETADASIKYADMRDAINEISSKDSQSEILKSLVHHAAQYTPRGAFFIVKNEHLVGWRMFGTEEHSNPQVVREVFFPVSSNTALSESIETLATIEGSSDASEDNLLYLNKLGFEQPENMYAIPLVARGRGVAVLYADNGTQGENVNVEALETLVRVAGLTVEVLASTQIARNQQADQRSSATTGNETEEVSEEQYSATESTPVAFAQPEPAETDFQSVESEDEETSAPETADPVEEFQAVEEEAVDQTGGYDTAQQFESVEQPAEYETEETATGFDYQTGEESTADSDAGQDVSYSADATAPEAVEDSFSYQDTTPEPVMDDESAGDYQTPTDDYTTSLEEDDYSVTFDSEDSGTEDTGSADDDYSVTYDSADSAESLSFDSGDANETAAVEDTSSASGFETPQFGDFSETRTEAVDDSSADSAEVSTEPAEYQFETNDVTDYGVSADTSGADNFSEQPEIQETSEPAPVETVSSPPVRPRFGDRNVDLPIEVSEDERRLHNDARRFARLLVSEIKLYNEQKVKEGRESSDLYERLREAIDRSREMYDKRVQPPVAAKFDYFNYELVNTLAEGEEGKLGDSYPGANV